MNAFIKILVIVSCLVQPLFSYNVNSSRSYKNVKRLEIEGGQKGLSLTVNSLVGEFIVGRVTAIGELSYIIKGNELYVCFSGSTMDIVNICLRDGILYFEAKGIGTFNVFNYKKEVLFGGTGSFSISGGLRNAVIYNYNNREITIKRKRK